MKVLKFDELTVYNSVYKYIDSNMFIIVEQNEALIIDPHLNDDLQEILSQNKIRHITILFTHEHADHISGAWWLLKNYECNLICSEECAKKVSNSHAVKPLLLSFVIEENDRKKGTNVLSEFKKDFVVQTYSANLTYSKDFHYFWHSHNLYFRAIQGHSVGSCIIVLDKRYIFTGDSLLKEYPVIVSFPQGNKKAFLEQSIPFMEKNLSPDSIVFPGHGDPFFMSEIMKDGKINVELR